VPYTWPGTDGSSEFVLSTNGTGQLSWVDISTATGGTNYWNESAGLISPKSTSHDFVIGGSSTASATFAVTNVGSGTPQMSISDGVNSLYITAYGTIGTSNNANLVIGSASTGDTQLFGFGQGILRTDANGILSSSAIDLSSGDVSGILPVANG